MAPSALLRLMAWPRRRLWLSLPLAYGAGLALLALLPDPTVVEPPSPALGGLAGAAFSVPALARNLLHLPLYMGLGALSGWSASAWSLAERRTLTLALGLSLTLAITLELAQSQVPGRSVAATDLLMNVGGATLGVLLIRWTQLWLSRRLTPEISVPGKLGALRSVDGRAPARWSTSVRIHWDNNELRLRFECEDEDAWGSFEDRDAPLWQEEVVEVFIAPGAADPTEYFELEVSPRGTLFDARIHNPTGRRRELRADTSWDCPGLRWRVGSLEARQDWWAELVLPWRSLVSQGEVPEVFRLNFFRIERPRGGEAEFSAWSPTFTHPADFHQPRCFGRLRRISNR